MSKAIYELTTKTIDLGYREKNENIIEKETDYLLGKIVTSMLSLFSDKIKGITFDKYGIRFDSSFLLSEKHKKNLFKWANKLKDIEQPSSDIEFGKLKVDFENWYYQLGGDEINFEYQEDYLLTPKEASEKLGISRVTLNKYIKQGLESVNTKSHNKIPKYVIELWKNPVYAIRMQMIAQEKKLRNQLPEERLEEINKEVTLLQIKYKCSSYQDAFNKFNGDSMDDPSDYYLWRDLENEKEEIIKLLGGK
ncbi:helix-turn-helix domain-containing protein [Niallia taxi]|uniref:helix-turn-helix domain-containing protein n=1 Tax=Niallia taxi TaxID=2499688 RepID=UPI0031787C41